MKALPWSGENSISARDNTAHVLAEHLSAEHAEHPQANQLVIAHSHGGNIALRALYLSQRRDSSQLCGGDSATPFVVTLATPFVEVHQADLGDRPTTCERDDKRVHLHPDMVVAFYDFPA
jgi:alpha-beta hydrolase superfamily lysophospholipase